MCDDVTFDQLMVAPEHAIRPYPVYADLRRRCPAHRTPFGVRLISRYNDVATMLRDRRLGRAPLRAGLTERLGAGTPLDRVFSAGVNFQDGESHRRIRSLLAAAFHRAEAARLRAVIRREAERLLDGTTPGKPFDLVETVAKPLPVFVICSLLGVARDDMPRLARLAGSISAAVEATPSTDARQAGQRAMAEIAETIAALVSARRRRPRDDLASAVAHAPAGTVSEEEIVGNLVLLFGAGHETTQTLIATAGYLVAGRTDLAEKVASDDGARQALVAEALRLESPTQVVGRIALEDVDAGEYRLAAGERLALLLGSAHRDERAFDAPEEVRLDRSTRHLAFGAGPHYCLGAELAAVEADEAVQALLRRGVVGRPVAPMQWRPTLVMRVPEEAIIVYG
jgi:cytochrome P450